MTHELAEREAKAEAGAKEHLRVSQEEGGGWQMGGGN